MLFTLEVLRAFEGDCLLLHWGDPQSPKLALIDGGPGETYRLHLSPRLKDLAQARGTPMELEFAMVSHVDNDHIVGVDKFFADLKAEVDRPEDQRTFRLKRLWHNAFDDVVRNELNAHYTRFTASFTASASGELPSSSVQPIKQRLEAKGTPADEAEHLAFDIAKIIAGHKEGRALRDKHRFLRQNHAIAELNRPFLRDGQGTLITAERTPTPVSIAGLNIHIVGPLEPEIQALQQEFDEYLEKKGIAMSPEAALAAYADTTAPNLSSIVCLVSVDIGGTEKRILLTGDARGDKMIEGLKKAGYLTDAAPSLHVDILKVPHHGSDRNVAPQFFAAISADTYVLSGDGKHGNPDRDVLKWIIESRAPQDQYKIVFSYGLDETDERRKKEARRPWNEQKHGLRALIDQKRQAGHDGFTIEDGGPMKIDLGEALTV